MARFPDPPAQIICPDCGAIVWPGQGSSTLACVACGNALPQAFQIVFITKAHTEHRLTNLSSEVTAWTVLSFIRSQFESGEFSTSLGITVDGTLIAPEDIETVSVVSMSS